jgi:hypothetical protein
MGKIQVNSLPCSPSSCIMEPLATVVNFVYTTRFSQHSYAAVMVAVWGGGGGWTFLIINAIKMFN